MFYHICLVTFYMCIFYVVAYIVRNDKNKHVQPTILDFGVAFISKLQQRTHICIYGAAASPTHAISIEFHSPLQWRHNERNGVSNHQPHDYLLNHLFWHRSKKTSTLRVTGLCEGNWPLTGEFPAQRANNAENVSIWWRHHAMKIVILID